MSEEYNLQIERVAQMILDDKISFDEQDDEKLKKFHEFVRERYKLEDGAATQLINEAFLYLKLKNADSIDPLQHGDEFGAGFS